MTMDDAIGGFGTALAQALEDGSFVKLSLGHYAGTEGGLKSIHIKQVIIKRAKMLSFTTRYKTRDIVKNYPPDAALEKIHAALGQDFRQALLCTTAFDLELTAPQGKAARLKKMPPSQREAPSLAHDRSKTRLVATAGKRWLHALGITDAQGNVLKSAQDKYRQIDKYVEILSALIKALPPERTRKVVDMGAGKGYLTFALYDYMRHSMGLKPQVRGVEYRADMVALCNKMAEESGFDGLRFTQGSIADYDAGGTDILIALHACDTATDDALAKGIAADAALIVVAPCCHKQIRRAMEKSRAQGNKNADFDFLLRHGIFTERQAEMVADGLRALILEYFGYTVKVFEFISDAHTPKNVMIVATRNPKMKLRDPEILKTIAAAKARFGIDRHYLEDAAGI